MALTEGVEWSSSGEGGEPCVLDDQMLFLGDKGGDLEVPWAGLDVNPLLRVSKEVSQAPVRVLAICLGFLF